MTHLRRIRHGAVNTLRRAKDRVANEPAMDVALLALVAFLVDAADGVDLASLYAAAEGHPWAVAFIVVAGVAVRQSVYSRRSHDLDEEWASQGESYLIDLEPLNLSDAPQSMIDAVSEAWDELDAGDDEL